MERVNPPARAQWYTSVGTMANLAGYGLRSYQRGERTAEVKELISKGLELSQILAEGAGATAQARVSTAQLRAMRAAAPFLRSKETVSGTGLRLSVATKIFEKILNDLEHGTNTVASTELDEVSKLLKEVSEVFVGEAFSALRSKQVRSGVVRIAR